ncbi:SPFH/Band 7/PHB domain protein [bacterium]|nr:SPFH/Band 7/PHB domain protein [bacterium]
MESFVVLVFAIVLILMGVKTVPQGREYLVQRFGRFVKVLSPGLHFIIPIFDRIAAKVNMKERVLDIPTQEVISQDNAIIQVDGVVFFQVIDSPKAVYEVHNLKRAIMNLSLTNIRTVMGSMELDELLSNRESINARLLQVVDLATNPWGIKVTRIEIKDITPPRDISEAMSKQMKAERERRAVILEAEGVKRSNILRAEGDKQSRILRAEGEKEYAYRLSEAREREAEAEAKATQMVSEAIAKGDVQAINYFVAEKYVDALKEVASAPNQKVLFMPLEAASVIGAIGGIGEIAKEAFGKKGEISG